MAYHLISLFATLFPMTLILCFVILCSKYDNFFTKLEGNLILKICHYLVKNLPIYLTFCMFPFLVQEFDLSELIVHAFYQFLVAFVSMIIVIHLPSDNFIVPGVGLWIITSLFVFWMYPFDLDMPPKANELIYKLKAQISGLGWHTIKWVLICFYVLAFMLCIKYATVLTQILGDFIFTALIYVLTSFTEKISLAILINVFLCDKMIDETELLGLVSLLSSIFEICSSYLRCKALTDSLIANSNNFFMFYFVYPFMSLGHETFEQTGYCDKFFQFLMKTVDNRMETLPNLSTDTDDLLNEYYRLCQLYRSSSNLTEYIPILVRFLNLLMFDCVVVTTCNKMLILKVLIIQIILELLAELCAYIILWKFPHDYEYIRFPLHSVLPWYITGLIVLMMGFFVIFFAYSFED